MLLHSKPQDIQLVLLRMPVSETSLLKSKLKLLLVDHLPTLKDYLMILMTKLMLNNKCTVICLVETKPLVLKNKILDVEKSVKEHKLSEELKTILLLVNLPSKKLL